MSNDNNNKDLFEGLEDIFDVMPTEKEQQENDCVNE